MTEEPEKAKPRVVLDSNVIISGFAFERGNPATILEWLFWGEIEVYISPFILEEISKSFREDFDWSESRIEEAVLLLRAYCIVIDPEPNAATPELTPADNRILDCAVLGKVQYLVTGDKGILQLKEFGGVVIVRPAEFLASIHQA